MFDAAAAAFFCASSSALVSSVVCAMAFLTPPVAFSTVFEMSVTSSTSSPTVPATVTKGMRGPVTLASVVVPAVITPVVNFVAASSTGFCTSRLISLMLFSTACDILSLT